MEKEIEHPGIHSFSMLSEKQLNDLHNGILEVLANTGVVFQHEKALDVLAGAGCTIENGGLVKFPTDIVEKAIESTPASVLVYDRESTLRMTLAGRNVYFGAGLTSPFLVQDDGTHVSYTLKECRKNSIVAEHMSNIDFTMAMAHVTDVPPEIRDVVEIATILKASSKPIIITSHTTESLDRIIELCGIISPSKDAFLQKPYLIYYTEPISPLKHGKNSLEKLFRAAEYGLPILDTPAPMAGGTSPITLSGTLICGMAEVLSGLVLIQAIRPGAPVIIGGVFTVLDMGGMIFSYGCPEMQLMNTAIAELARKYRIPSFGTAGTTDAHELDMQAAFECGTSIFANALSGSNLVHDVGWLSSGLATSNELLVLCNEMISYARRYMSGLDTGRISESIKELNEIGPGGNFISRDLTFDLWRKETWYPRFIRRMPQKTWISKKPGSMRSALKEEVHRIVTEEGPAVMPKSISHEIDELLKILY